MAAGIEAAHIATVDIAVVNTEVAGIAIVDIGTAGTVIEQELRPRAYCVHNWYKRRSEQAALYGRPGKRA